MNLQHHNVRQIMDRLEAGERELVQAGYDLDRHHLSRHRLRFAYTMSAMPHQEGVIVDLGASASFNCLLNYCYPKIRIIPADHPVGRAGQTKEINHNGDMPGIAPTRYFDFGKDPFPFDDSSVDGVLFLEVLEHLIYSPTTCLSEVCRILKPGGYLLLSTPNILSWKHIFRAIEGIEPLEFSEFVSDGNGSTVIQHAKEFTPYEVRDLVSDSGLNVADWRTQTVSAERRLSGLEKLCLPGLMFISQLLLRHPKHFRARGEKTFLLAHKDQD